MKHMYAVFAAVLSAVALMGLAAGSASATTLEVGGVPKNEPVAITASVAPGTTMVFGRTDGVSITECSTSHVQGSTTSPFTAPTVTMPVTSMTTEGCTKAVTIHKPGKWEVVWTSGTNATVYSQETEMTASTPFGTIRCTGGTTQIGTLTGVASGHATIDINAVLPCGFLLPSFKWTGKYTVTNPSGLGVSA